MSSNTARYGSVSFAAAIALGACTLSPTGAGYQPPENFGASSTPALSTHETCDNGLDDTGDGLIDEGCTCSVGASQPCWPSDPALRGVGICTDGTQLCEGKEEFGAWSTCGSYVLPRTDVPRNGIDEDCSGGDGPNCRVADTGEVCGDGVDNDCDEIVDCADPDCNGNALCCAPEICDDGIDNDCDGSADCDDPDCYHPICCVSGEAPTYTERDLGSSLGGSSVSEGDGLPIMELECAPVFCPDGQVQVKLTDGTTTCAGEPPICPDGYYPTYDSGWRCDLPCEVIVHYGGLYGGLTKCAANPDLSCGDGEVPTFVFETESWECRPTCDNGLYDQQYLNGMLVCVPC